MKILVIGPQGSGKGTQAEILSKKFNAPYISTGVIFRQAVKDKTELGKQVKQIIDAGKLVSDELTNKIIKERLSQSDCQNGFVMDGFPRNLIQTEFLDNNFSSDKALEIWISDQEAISRISGRRSCPKCGKVYHLKFNPPEQDEICNECNEKLTIRDDDQEDAIKKRLAIYHEQTEPVLNFYNSQNKLIKINGEPPIAEVTKEIFKKL